MKYAIRSEDFLMSTWGSKLIFKYTGAFYLWYFRFVNFFFEMAFSWHMHAYFNNRGFFSSNLVQEINDLFSIPGFLFKLSYFQV